MDDNTENGFRIRIASAETPQELSQIRHEMSMYLPEDNPAVQNANRHNLMHGTFVPVTKMPTK